MATSRTSGAAVPAGVQSRKAAIATSEQSERSYSSPKLPGEKSDTSPAVPAAVIYKLLAFTFAMITLPISSYFMTVNTVFGGNSTYAGALAAIMANVVLFGYVFAAMKEDQADQLEEKKKMMSSRKAE